MVHTHTNVMKHKGYKYATHHTLEQYNNTACSIQWDQDTNGRIKTKNSRLNKIRIIQTLNNTHNIIAAFCSSGNETMMWNTFIFLQREETSRHEPNWF
jgi:hypothetical protein